MCGVVGYIGKRKAAPILMDGLRRLEYRGYDSAGLSVLQGNGTVLTVKSPGNVGVLEGQPSLGNLSGTAGIAHIRWATHGAPSEANAHPHFDCTRNFFVVHNGIIENYEELRRELMEEGHAFSSETDTEVVAHLIEKFFVNDLRAAVVTALEHLRGAYALVVMSAKDPNHIIATKKSAPLVIGTAGEEYFVASDVTAILPYTKRVGYLNDGEVVIIGRGEVTYLSPMGSVIDKKYETIDWNIEAAEKNGFPHFTLKEIFEQPTALRTALAGRIMGDSVYFEELGRIAERLERVERIVITGCGTAYYAGMVGQYLFQEYSDLPATVELASEFRYKKPVLDEKTLVICMSQSGETADTIAALHEAKKKKALTIGIVNAIASTIAREVDTVIYNRVGPEIGVASTKAFTSQVAILYLLSVFFGARRKVDTVLAKSILEEIKRIPSLVEAVLEQHEYIRQLAERYAGFQNFFYIGRKYQFPVALEGSLKLKEISYIHAEGYGAGEMKHGPIALIDETFPTVAIVPADSVYEKTRSNLEEIKARSGPIIAVATDGNNEIKNITQDVIFVPKTIEPLNTIVVAVALQLFAYYASVARNLDPDRPRNLAKSVTVE